MKKIIDYQIIMGNPGIGNPKTLEEKVKDAMQNGWQPLGGIAVNPNGIISIGTTLQTMVKYEEE